MTILIRAPVLEYQLLEKRKAIGADRYDEVWDRVYVIGPKPEPADSLPLE
jgi:hypothetical protein